MSNSSPHSDRNQSVSSKTKCNKRVPPRREMQTFSKRSERLSASLGEEKETTSNTNKKRETAVSQRLINFVL